MADISIKSKGQVRCPCAIGQTGRFYTLTALGRALVVLFINDAGSVCIPSSGAMRCIRPFIGPKVARALMIALVFFGVCHLDGGSYWRRLFLRFLPERVRPYVVHANRWILFLVSVGLIVSSYDLVQAARLPNHGETSLPADNLRHSGADWFRWL